ncbi:MAG TPA: ABC transporter permease [Blastocatellia bacterium]|nr:ABC transporter permease [Blastocatellia bacterium]
MRRPKDLIREPLPADATKRVVAAPEGIVGGDLGAAFPAVRMEQAELVEGVSLWQDAWKRLRRNKLAVAGGVIVLTVFILALAGPWLVYQYNGFTYQTQDLSIRLAEPSWQHPLGTDILGRDLLARLLYGSRISLLVGLIATMVSLVIGVTYGAIAGYFGGRVDDVMMRIVDVIYSLPYIILVVILLALFERSLFLLFAALGAVSWLTMARIVRGQVLSLKNEQFIEAARSIGVSNIKIIFRHIVPNTLGPVIVYATLTVPSVILQEAFLSFLGLGVQPPTPSWGVLASEGSQAIAVHPLLLIAPGAMMALTLFSLNFLGDGLRDALDPQMRKV